jgi:hypothetical protein
LLILDCGSEIDWRLGIGELTIDWRLGIVFNRPIDNQPPISNRQSSISPQSPIHNRKCVFK